MEMEAVGKTFLQVRIFNADQTKKGLSEPDWAEFFDGFLQSAQQTIHPHGGEIVKLTPDGILVVFEDAVQGVQAAIDLQESATTISAHPSCAIGISSGPVFECYLQEGERPDYIGSPIDIAALLSVRARGNAILLNSADSYPADSLQVTSQAGRASNRPQNAYFVEQSPLKFPSLAQPVGCYSIFWQEQPTHFLTTNPVEESLTSEMEVDLYQEEQIYFGRVSAFKKERGFGFIQYYSEDQEYREIYFHMTYVINQISIQEHDHVQFTIKPGKEGRPQACSVLVMGSRLQGQMESLECDGSGHVTIHNQDSGLIRFFVLPQELRSSTIQVNDIVEFTVGSGSEMEGLIALNIQPFEGKEGPSEVVGSGDNLKIGSVERAVITVYFVEKGYGFAKCRRNNVYIHVSELTSPENVPNPGDIIEFDVFPGRDGTYRANNIRLVMKKGLTL
ncbi:MAG: cold shock domain-containing protein [Magnetococcales bacterium]|nr:cold shock domain-containing protein [Magnetococcales bacterium]